jgi:sugar O-acyltransferase (sialic acid O-acetyltransferase NeuD family)
VAARHIIVIGGGGHGKVILHMLSRMPSFHPLGYVDPRNSGPLLGFPHLGGDDALPALVQKYPGLNAVIGVGKVVAGSQRMQLLAKLKELGLSLPAVVAPTAMVARTVVLGEGTVVMDGAVIQPDSVVGKIGIINSRSCVDHDCFLGDDVHIGPAAALSGGVKINDGCMIGVGASVIQGVRITKNCTIGAGAAVTSDCAEAGVYVGVPAKKISDGSEA